jgi:hypothetical protein
VTQRTQRLDDERNVLGVLKNKQQLAGTLEAEKLQLQQGEPADKANDYDKLRVDFETFKDDFVKAGGKQYDDAPLWFDDWKPVDGNWNFDSMVNQLHGHSDRIDEWASKQPNDDAKAAAFELTSIMKRYESARSWADTSSTRLGQIDSQLGELRSSMAADEGSLSGEVKRDYQTFLHDASKQLANLPHAGTGDVDSGSPNSSGSPDDRDSGAAHVDPPATSGGADGDSDTAAPSTTDKPVPTSKVTAADIVNKHDGLGASYTVTKGDYRGLSDIANRYNSEWGTKLTWRDLYSANRVKISDPNLIYPGQVFTIPQIGGLVSQEVGSANAAIAEQAVREAQHQRVVALHHRPR